ncbi:MAG: hypothetical protein ACI9XC_002621, partial [Gammaproteobacteria bacterium]
MIEYGKKVSLCLEVGYSDIWTLSLLKRCISNILIKL